MADTPKELDEREGPCRYCGEEIFAWEADWSRIGDEVAHKGCIENENEQRAKVDYSPDWEQDYEHRGNE